MEEAYGSDWTTTTRLTTMKDIQVVEVRPEEKKDGHHTI
jgi:hypothetical protein